MAVIVLVDLLKTKIQDVCVKNLENKNMDFAIVVYITRIDMRIKGIIEEDFVNYKKPCMTIMFPKCNFKCDKECGLQVCQNSTLANYNDINTQTDTLITRYLLNNITSAICMQGLEPFDTFDDLYEFIQKLRIFYNCNDDIIIYTGYNKNEIKDKIDKLKKFDNIIIKYGRYVPNQESHYDAVLGVNLASDNQYAERLK